jgi:hypothetical protein
MRPIKCGNICEKWIIFIAEGQISGFAPADCNACRAAGASTDVHRFCLFSVRNAYVSDIMWMV